VATWLLGQAADWFRLAQVERLLDYAWLEGQDPTGQDYTGYRAFLAASGFSELTRTKRGWTRTRTSNDDRPHTRATLSGEAPCLDRGHA
jgi:hypothetical protein